MKNSFHGAGINVWRDARGQMPGNIALVVITYNALDRVARLRIASTHIWMKWDEIGLCVGHQIVPQCCASPRDAELSPSRKRIVSLYRS